MENCDDAYGFPPYPVIAQYLYTRKGVDLRELELDVVRNGLARTPATLLRSTSMDWWQRVPALMGIALEEPAAPVASPAPIVIAVESAEQVA